MTDNTDSDLAFATSEQLVDELAKRCEHLVVLSILKTDVKPTCDRVTTRIYGGAYAAVGLMTTGLDRLRIAMSGIDDDTGTD